MYKYILKCILLFHIQVATSHGTYKQGIFIKQEQKRAIDTYALLFHYDFFY